MKVGKEINLMASYPKTKRDPSKRAVSKTLEDQLTARRFGEDFSMVRGALVTAVIHIVHGFGVLWCQILKDTLK